ncbi:MAG TPA: DUF6518 family protein [Micromonospora sp.]|nr:DUF6518 family protein [Micromonospora sp.]
MASRSNRYPEEFKRDAVALLCRVLGVRRSAYYKPMTLSPPPRVGEYVPSAALGVGLGLAAYIPDTLNDSGAPYVNPFFSSGFAWGFAALLAGYMARRQRVSVVAGGATLAIAVIAYYSLILFVNQRWYVDASNTEDGLPSSAGLLSVGRSIAFWALAGVSGGGMMGWLGWTIRQASAHRGSTALGAALGLLTGEAVFTLIHVKSIYLGPLDTFDLSKLIPSLIQITLAVIAVAIMVILRKRSINWRVAIVVGATSVALSALLWYAVLTVRILL